MKDLEHRVRTIAKKAIGESAEVTAIDFEAVLDRLEEWIEDRSDEEMDLKYLKDRIADLEDHVCDH